MSFDQATLEWIRLLPDQLSVTLTARLKVLRRRAATHSERQLVDAVLARAATLTDPTQTRRAMLERRAATVRRLLAEGGDSARALMEARFGRAYRVSGETPRATAEHARSVDERQRDNRIERLRAELAELEASLR